MEPFTVTTLLQGKLMLWLIRWTRVLVRKGWQRYEWMSEWMSECPHAHTTPWISLIPAVPQRVHSLRLGVCPGSASHQNRGWHWESLRVKLAAVTMTQDILEQGSEHKYLADPIQTHTFSHVDTFTVTKIILQPDENTEKDHWQRRVGSWISMPLEV